MGTSCRDIGTLENHSLDGAGCCLKAELGPLGIVLLVSHAATDPLGLRWDLPRTSLHVGLPRSILTKVDFDPGQERGEMFDVTVPIPVWAQGRCGPGVGSKPGRN